MRPRRHPAPQAGFCGVACGVTWGVTLGAVAAVSFGWAPVAHASNAQAATVQPRDGDPCAVTAVALAHAAEARERARRLRALGDDRHARSADGLAQEWTDTARDLERAVAAEARAAEMKRKDVETQAQLERTRALVEASIARVGRLRAELDKGAKPGPDPTAPSPAAPNLATPKPTLRPRNTEVGPASQGQP